MGDEAERRGLPVAADDRGYVGGPLAYANPETEDLRRPYYARPTQARTPPNRPALDAAVSGTSSKGAWVRRAQARGRRPHHLEEYAPGNLLDWFLGVPRRPLRHPSRRRQRRVLDAPRRTFGDRPLIGRQGLRHALALLRLLVLRPCGPRRELLPLREVLPLAHGVPLRINRCIMPYPRLWVQRGSGALGRCGLVFGVVWAAPRAPAKPIKRMGEARRRQGGRE
jgi:hypothetical protein